jgi:cell division protease FtsH
MQYGRPGGEVFLGRDYVRQQDYSDEVAAFIDEEVRQMIIAAHSEALLILEAHTEAMEKMVGILLEKETVGPEELAEIFADVPKWEHDPEGGLRIRRPEAGTGEPKPELAAAASQEAPTPSEPTGRKPRVLLPRMKPADAPGS